MRKLPWKFLSFLSFLFFAFSRPVPIASEEFITGKLAWTTFAEPELPVGWPSWWWSGVLVDWLATKGGTKSFFCLLISRNPPHISSGGLCRPDSIMVPQVDFRSEEMNLTWMTACHDEIVVGAKAGALGYWLGCLRDSHIRGPSHTRRCYPKELKELGPYWTKLQLQLDQAWTGTSSPWT